MSTPNLKDSRPRARDLGITLGQLPCGTLNAITDVAGVQVGHSTIYEGSGKLIPGKGPIRTGVTAVLPHTQSPFRYICAAGAHVINGFGKCTGLPQLWELGQLESPILLTSTMNTWRVADAAVDWMLERNPDIAIDSPTLNMVVGECHDGFLNDSQGRHVRRQHVFEALNSASSGPITEGVVGAGTGMSVFGFKGGVGTSSRVLPEDCLGFTVGALIVSNFGGRDSLRIDGVPVGKLLADMPVKPGKPSPGGSIMIILATDAPLTSRQLTRLARRAAVGLVRTGGIHGHYSGEFAIAFSTTNKWDRQLPVSERMQTALSEDPKVMGKLFRAVAETTEEAVINSLLKAETVIGRDGNTREAISIESLVEIMRRSGYPDVGRDWFGETLP